MRKAFTEVTLILQILLVAISAYAADVRTEKLGPMPCSVIITPNDPMNSPQYISDMEKAGYSVEVSSCKTAPFDRHLSAIVPTLGGKCCVWLDGKTQAEYDQIRGIVKGAYRAADFAFSPDGRRLAYAARKGAKWVMVVDGQEGPEFDRVREPYFSADSKHVAYVGFRGKECALVMDGKERGSYPGVGMSLYYINGRTPLRRAENKFCPVAFSSTDRFAFVACKGRRNGEDRDVVVIDGKESPEYDDVQGIEFSPDAQHVAYAARKGGKMLVVQDGKPGAKYDDIDGLLTFSPDGRRLAYLVTASNAPDNAKSFVVVDGKPGPKFEQIDVLSIVFSPDSKHITYTAMVNGDRYCVVTDGKAGMAYDEIGNSSNQEFAMYGPDGRLYYTAKRGGECSMLVDGKASAAYDDIEDPLPVLSPNGKHYAFVAKSGEKWFVVKDGAQQQAYGGVDSNSLMITDSNRLAYSATSLDGSKRVAVLDGKEVPGAGRVTLSPDGSRAVYLKTNSDFYNPTIVEMDGQKIGNFATVLGFNFGPDNSLTFLAVRDNSTAEKASKELYRVRVGSGN